MHEWALADGIISTVLAFAESKKASRVSEIVVRVGEIQQINTETFKFIIEEFFKNHERLFRDTKLRIHEEKCTLECKNCGHEWGFSSVKGELGGDDGESIHFIPELAHNFMRCPNCKGPDFRIKEGRGVWVERIKWE